MDKDEYLDMLSDEEEWFFSMFYKRFVYLTGLGKDIGTGNYNSDICIIVDRYEDKVKCVKFLQKYLLNDINISLWNVYTTCRIKNDDLSEKAFNQELKCELSAVQPKIIFYFTRDKESSHETVDGIEYVYINIKDVDYMTDENKDAKEYKKIVDNLKKYSLKLVLLRDIE